MNQEKANHSNFIMKTKRRCYKQKQSKTKYSYEKNQNDAFLHLS